MTHLFQIQNYFVNEREEEHSRTVLEARWMGKGEPRITVRQSGDGCICIAIKHNFLYAGEDEILRDMLNVFIDRRAVKRAAFEDSRRADDVEGGFFVRMDTTDNGFEWELLDKSRLNQATEEITFQGWPVVRTRGGFPLFKHDIDRVGRCYIVFGPMPQAEAQVVAARAKEGEVITSLPPFVGLHTDG